MDEDEERYEEGRREHRKRVTVAIIAALGAVTMLVVRFGLQRERDHHFAQPVYVPSLPSPAPALAAVAREPIEFQLVAGTTTLDVVPDQPLALPGGANIEIERNPTWLTAGDGFHFVHRSSVSISTSPDEIVATVDGTAVKLQPMPDGTTEAEFKRLQSSALESTGQTVGEPTPSERKIAGQLRKGVEHATTTALRIELYVVPVGNLRLGVLVYRQDPRADSSKIDALLESIAEGPGEPLPEFRAKVGTTPVDLFLDKPTELALAPPATVTMKRRPTVLRTMTGNGGALTFEHARGVSVSKMPNDQMLVVTIQNELAAIQLMDLPIRFSVDELIASLMGTTMKITDLGEVTHTHAGQTLRGRKLRLASLQLENELYVLERGGKHIGASIQYGAADEQAVMDLALPILTSVR